MTEKTTARFGQHLNTGGKLALLVWIDYPDEASYVWSRTGTLEYDGHSWKGVGTLGKISGISKSTQLAIKQVTLSLRGVPPASANLGQLIRNRDSKVWLAGMKGSAVIADPYLIAWLKLDNQGLKVEDNGLATINVVGNAGFWSDERAMDLAWTHEQQQIEYPGDTGLSQLPALTNKDSNWRPS